MSYALAESVNWNPDFMKPENDQQQTESALAPCPGYAPRWEETWDDYDNSVWEADSPYTDNEGFSEGITWRLKQRLTKNAVEWFDASDPELGTEAGGDPRTWKTLEEAKADVAKDHRDIIAAAVGGEGHTK